MEEGLMWLNTLDAAFLPKYLKKGREEPDFGGGKQT